MKKYLFITSAPISDDHIPNGGELLSKNYFNILSRAHHVEPFIIKPRFKGRFLSKLYGLVNCLLGLTTSFDYFDLIKLLSLVKRESRNIESLILDSSKYGFIGKVIRIKYPHIKIITLFHNCESSYMKLKHGDAVLYKPKLFSIGRSEKLTIDFSDLCIFLNDRDRLDLLEMSLKPKKYMVIPPAFEDLYVKANIDHNKESYLLFVGSAFFANVESLRWYLNHVHNKLNMKIKIVGRGFENYAEEFSKDNVEVVGSVSDLSKYYLNASAVIVPILDGSGIKIKTGEALMWGKKILASPESLSGYPNVKDLVDVYECNNIDEYIKAVHTILLENSNFSESNRSYFLSNLSFNSISKKIHEAISL
ncbi:TPA: glycosyltransferase family 4 protein [Vibrio vulnificus]